MCRGFNFPPINGHINSNKILLVFLTFNYFYGTYFICKCTCTFTCRNSISSLIFQFHQNNSQLLFHIIVRLRGTGAFSRDFDKSGPLCRAFTRALKIEKLNAPLFPGTRVAGDTNDWCIIRKRHADLPVFIRSYLNRTDMT